MRLNPPAFLLAAGLCLYACSDPAPSVATASAPESQAAVPPSSDPAEPPPPKNNSAAPTRTSARHPATAPGDRRSTESLAAPLLYPGGGLLAEVQQVLSGPVTYPADPAQGAVLEAAGGTTVTFPADAFVLSATGERPDGPVQVRLQECYSTSDILLANLSTSSNGRLLETGGMIYLDARYNGQACELAPGREVEVAFPYDSPKPGMQLFTGSWNGRQLDWTPLYEPRYRTRLSDGTWVFDNETGARIPTSERRYESVRQEALQWPRGFEGPVTLTDVQLSFVISEYGIPERVRVTGGPDDAFRSALARSFTSSMPCWMPAQRNGLPVANAFTQRISYWWPFNAGVNDSLIQVRFDGLHFDSLFSMHGNVPGRYVLRSRSLGWINCDRFYNDAREKVNFYVDAGRFDEGDVKIVFHKIRSVLQGQLDSGRFAFRGIPVGEPVTVVAIRKSAAGFELALKEGVTGNSVLSELAFEPVTLGCLKERLADLNEPGRADSRSAARTPPPMPLLTASR